MVLKRTESCVWWGVDKYLYDVISVSSRLSEVPLGVGGTAPGA